MKYFINSATREQNLILESCLIFPINCKQQNEPANMTTSENISSKILPVESHVWRIYDKNGI